MIIVVGHARFAAGEIERLREPFSDWVGQVRQRDGCILHEYSVDLADPDLLHVTEIWRDEAAVDAHMADMGDLMNALAGAKLHSIKVDAYEGAYLKSLMGG